MTIALTPAEVAYYRSIRNPAKRAYALRYLEIGDAADGARDAEGTSYMARQAVRLRVAELRAAEGPA